MTQLWKYKFLKPRESQTCAVAESDKFWRATGQSGILIPRAFSLLQLSPRWGCGVGKRPWEWGWQNGRALHGQSVVVWVRKPNFESFVAASRLSVMFDCHVIGVCLPSQSASAKHNQEKKAHKPLRTSYISQEMFSRNVRRTDYAFERTLPTHGHFNTDPEKETSSCLVWKIKEEKTTAVVYIASFQGCLLEYDRGGEGSTYWRRGAHWKKHVLPGALIGHRALVGIFILQTSLLTSIPHPPPTPTQRPYSREFLVSQFISFKDSMYEYF